jgi:Tol biopolymer transport system component
LLWRSTEAQNISDWSPDGKFVLLASQSATTARDLWLVPVAPGDRTPIAFARTPAEESQGRFSPDGTLIAYFSDETGRMELFVRPVSGSRPAVQVSTQGAIGAALSAPPVWSEDGRELYYSGTGEWTAATITVKANGTIDVGTSPLPIGHLPGEILGTDGAKRFLVRTTIADPSPPTVSVIVNWK